MTTIPPCLAPTPQIDHGKLLRSLIGEVEALFNENEALREQVRYLADENRKLKEVAKAYMDFEAGLWSPSL